MKTTGRIKFGAATIVLAALLFAFGGRILPGHHGVRAAFAAEKAPSSSAIAHPVAPTAMPLGLPSVDTAKAMLDASLPQHHPQWLDVPMGGAQIRVFVLFPDLAGKAPVAVITAHNQGLSDWARAVGTEVVNEGYITIVPDLLSGLGPNGGGTDSFANPEAIATAFAQLGPAEIQRRTEAVRNYFVAQPGTNGKSAILDFNWTENRIEAAISSPSEQRAVKFDLTEHAWHNTLALLSNLAGPEALPQTSLAMPQLKDDAASAASAARQRDAAQAIAKRDDIVAGRFGGPEKVVDQSPRHGEWVDIPASTSQGMVKLHAWLVQPLGNDKAGVVVLIHPGPGMDNADTPRKGAGANWMRGVADKLAMQGFIVIMPDLASGLGPNGGNFDSFRYPDDLAKALGTRPVPEKIELLKAAREYALKLPRANGKSGITGFCNGGGYSWESAAEIPGINAAVSFYGAPPDLATMAKIQAPVLAFAGDQDPGLAPKVAAAAPDMQKLGKTFEFKIYPNVTHAFLEHQTLGENAVATLDSWPRAMAFFKRYLNAQTSTTNTRTN
jgi:carboxymethylenebutenolidase